MTSMTVTKTLVIGLGSTGTQTCNHLVSRLEWELGSLDRAPWVRFLAIDTNHNEPTPLRERSDFIAIGFDSRTHQQVVQHPETFTTIRLSEWADTETLRKIADPEAGVSNIRMGGRLAFLLEHNFKRVKNRLLDHLSTLRALSAAEATHKRGPLRDGSDPTVEFAEGGHVRVVVVGTLAGGTGSGLAPDFGYFLRTLMKDEESTLAFFILPHRGLSHTIDSNADRLKKNAYHALLELNHLAQATHDDVPPVRYPDGSEATFTRYPYDMPYLLAPAEPTRTSFLALPQLIADRVLLLTMNPEMDTAAQAVNAPMPDRDHQAHIFNTFGLSAIEFPAAHVMEACTKKLLSEALQQWQSAKPGVAQDLTARLGVDYERLVTRLLGKTQEEWREDEVREALRELEAQKPDFGKLARMLQELRQQVQEGGALTASLRERRNVIVREAYAEFRARVREALQDRALGPAVLHEELNQLLSYLGQLEQAAEENARGAQADIAESWRRVEDGVTRLRNALAQRSLLRPNRAAIDAARRDLREALREYARVQVEANVYFVLRTHRLRLTEDLGIVEMLRRLLLRSATRLRKLDGRVTHLRTRLFQRYRTLAETVPPVNGLPLFEVNTTVQREFERGIQHAARDVYETPENVQARLHADIIAAWAELPDAIAPDEHVKEETWVSADYDPKAELIIPQAQLDRLTSVARGPFEFLATENVVERLEKLRQGGESIDARVKSAAGRAEPFLAFDPEAAKKGNRSPVKIDQYLLLPRGTSDARKDEFRHLVSGSFAQGSTNVKDSPDPTRVLFLVERYRFPLRALPDVLGRGGLAEAECGDFPTFHTRRDVNWYGLSAAEEYRHAEAEQALVLGVLLDELRFERGLVMPWEARAFGDRPTRRLPMNLTHAARLLAKGERDLDGMSLQGALEVLLDRIRMHWQKPGLSPEDASRAFIQDLMRRLRAFHERYHAVPIEGWKNELWAGEQLMRYASQQPALLAAYISEMGVDGAQLARLWKNKGDRAQWGVAPQDGYYCDHPNCGGFIGKDERDAARNGWRCFINEAHYWGPPLGRSAVRSSASTQN
ncbi:tubulin-like doman-containing protein [Deinococcus sp. YIM 77859]|uniref:tubulin-like doman-containing protein n=1 Tax=Deinococcus sp. YIM 77859 TaxID=1540221 RepID=UPI0005589620|nr:tubulin-like doman-containing protein [Deinococcus sp. YIM 77859]